jgi:hypothetical protein
MKVMEYFNNYEKRLGSGDAGIGFYSYPSYLGINIFTADMPSSLLGMTNGRRILLNKDAKEAKEFVIFHEEEHVKDMSASELEVDKRALTRMKKSGRMTQEKEKTIKKLMKKRWGRMI